MRATAAASGLLYLAVLAAPALHEAFLEEEHCSECGTKSGPFLVEDCSGPCQDPDHHHHDGGHHRHGCPLCQKSQIAGTSLTRVALSAALEDATATALPPPPARPLVFAGIHPARAPPPAA
jgi:hypothetical protein